MLHVKFPDPIGKRPKCARYWPEVEAGVEDFGHMHIKLLGESKMNDDKDQPMDEIIQRTFEISNGTGGNSIYLSSH